MTNLNSTLGKYDTLKNGTVSKILSVAKNKTTNVLLSSLVVGSILFGYSTITNKHHDNISLNTTNEYVVSLHENNEPDYLGKFISNLEQPEETIIHVVQKGDNVWKIANTYKPDNVDIKDYMKLLSSKIDKRLHIGDEIELPSTSEMVDIILPEIELTFNLYDQNLINDIKHAEGSFEGQQTIKRRLLNGVGSPVQNGKFYPYQDSAGNWTIGYGHFIARSNNKYMALKYSDGLTPYQAEQLLKDDMHMIKEELIILLQQKRLGDVPENVQIALFELTYNMGRGNLGKFNTMFENIKNGDYEQASKSLSSSKWKTQVSKERSSRIIALMSNQ